MVEIVRGATIDELADLAANQVLAIGRAAIARRGWFNLALSGGSTPRALHQRLASPTYASQLDWSRVRVFFGDERCVGPDHPDSNYGMAQATLLSHLPVPPDQIHRLSGEVDPTAAATAYATLLQQVLGDRPRLDLILLGMGDDGHTASLFPNTAAIHEARRWVIGHYVKSLAAWRLTLTPVIINAAAEIFFLVSGTNKAERLRQVLEGPWQPERLPAQIVRPSDGRVTWYIDTAAAAALTSTV